MRKPKSKIIQDGEFNYMHVACNERGDCDVVVATNDGRSFRARGRMERGKLIILDDEEVEWGFRGGRT